MSKLTPEEMKKRREESNKAVLSSYRIRTPPKNDNKMLYLHSDGVIRATADKPKVLEFKRKNETD